jgi:glycosyltransferase involved in cell wall biosynthesis
MLNAIEYVNKNHMLYLAGEFTNPTIKRRAQHHKGWERVKYFGFLDQAQVSLLHKECLIGLILYEHIGQYYMANSLKLFEFMLSEMPIIMPDFGDWPRFNKENQCGICVDVRDSKRIGAAINSLFHDPDEAERLGKNGKKAVEKKYNWTVSENNLINIYQKILN